MNVGVNVCQWGDRPVGLGRYTSELVKSLAATGMPLKFYLFTPDKQEIAKMIDKELIVREKSFDKPNSFWQMRICWEQKHLPMLIQDTPVDIFHAPVYVLPMPYTLQNEVKTIVTVHDVIYCFRPDDYSPEALAYLNLYVPLSLKMAHHIIAISERTKADIITYFGVEEEKITVVPLAPARQFTPQPRERVEIFRKQYDLPPKFILYVGSLVRRKNIPVLLEAYAILKERSGCSEKLVIAGGDAAIGTHRHEIVKKLNSLKLARDVILTDYFPDHHLPLLFSAASIFAYPSLYEGFGLPPLEAMACGVPVVTSNASSLPEVVGDAALTVTPSNPFDLAEAMRQVLESRDLSERLTSAGLRQAARFSWRKTATETLKIYQKVVTNGDPFSERPM